MAKQKIRKSQTAAPSPFVMDAAPARGYEGTTIAARGN